jgi:hypothetical protein
MHVQLEHYDKFINEKYYESFSRVQIFGKKQYKTNLVFINKL